MHNPGTSQRVAREIIKEKTEKMERQSYEFAIWLDDAEQGGGINGREADKLRQRIVVALQGRSDRE